MTRPRLLDLYCCAGGAGVGYDRAGFEVFGIDIEPQPNYPFSFERWDALAVLDEMVKNNGELEIYGRFDAIHASPPCQTHSALTKGNRGRPGWADDHTDLVGETRDLLDQLGLPYVIENVQGAPVRRDLTLCGEMFGLSVIRHRYFELGGWTMPRPVHKPHRGRVAGWRHGIHYDGPYVAVYGDGGGKGSVADWQNAMGIWHTDVKAELAEAIPPAYTHTIGTHLLKIISAGSGLSGASRQDRASDSAADVSNVEHGLVTV